jgi:hypothetical protein
MGLSREWGALADQFVQQQAQQRHAAESTRALGDDETRKIDGADAPS